MCKGFAVKATIKLWAATALLHNSRKQKAEGGKKNSRGETNNIIPNSICKKNNAASNKPTHWIDESTN